MTKRILTSVGVICLVLFASIVIKAAIFDIPPTGFIAEDMSNDFQISWGGWGEYVYRVSGASEYMAVAPVTLPDSYLIRSFRAHFVDNDATNNASIGLVAHNKYTGTRATIFMVTTTGSSTAVRYGTDYSAPTPAQALTNSGALSWHCFVSYHGTGEANFKCYGCTIEADPWP